MKILASRSDMRVTGRTYRELIDNLESLTGISIDSADKRTYSQFITGYRDDKEYEIEVSRYSGGGYEVMLYNILDITTGEAMKL